MLVCVLSVAAAAPTPVCAALPSVPNTSPLTLHSCLTPHTPVIVTVLNMYRFQRSGGPGGRLFLSGTRQGEDNDRMSVRSGSLAANDNDDIDLHQVLTHRRLTTETQASGHDSTRVERRGKIKSTTTRVVKKTTTVTRGDQRMVAEAILRTSDTHQEDINNISPQSGWHSRTVTKRPKMQAVGVAWCVGGVDGQV